jgi:DnaJ-class molecular chaperone
MDVKDPKGFYRRLGIDPSASSETVKSAYRCCAKQLHPDRNATPEAKAKFQEINEAYQTLVPR